MNSGIHTYEDLVEYKKNLQELLYLQRQVIVDDIEMIKDKVRPVTEIAAQASKLFIPSQNESMLVKIVNTAVDLLMKNVIVKRSGWLTKAVVPFLVHNLSSHLVGDNQQSILKKFIGIFFKKKKKTEKNNT
ncbi:MAG: hypothetical protein QM764_11660 [Chitinophagaceae bacterium]